MPIVLNQDNVVLDGHHRLTASKKLGIPVSYSIKDFAGKPLDEIKYFVCVNLHRRHLDEFQRAEVAIKLERYEAYTRFNNETAGGSNQEMGQ